MCLSKSCKLLNKIIINPYKIASISGKNLLATCLPGYQQIAIGHRVLCFHAVRSDKYQNVMQVRSMVNAISQNGYFEREVNANVIDITLECEIDLVSIRKDVLSLTGIFWKCKMLLPLFDFLSFQECRALTIHRITVIAAITSRRILNLLRRDYFPYPRYYIGAMWMPSTRGGQDFAWRRPFRPQHQFTPAQQIWAPGQPVTNGRGRPLGYCVYAVRGLGWFNERFRRHFPGICVYFS